MLNRLGFVCVFALPLVMLCGCGGRGTVDLRARVTLDGKPVEGASVTLVSSGETKNRTAAGITDADGNVKFTTFEPDDGVLPGEYKVLISKAPKSLAEEFVNFDPNNPDDVARMQARERGGFVPYTPTALPRIYLDPAQSPFTCTVPADDQPVVFALESSAGKRR
jgi:hypothetical protein